MDAKTLSIFFLLLTPFVYTWQTPDRRSSDLRRDIHYHSKRHMLPREPERKRRTTTQRPKEIRKKPTGHLRPLQEDEMGNDEVVSVAVGPPIMRPKYDKFIKYVPKPINTTDYQPSNFIKDVLAQIGRELLTHQVNEDFIFGQYIATSFKNITADLKLRLQHEILDLIIKYQKISQGFKVVDTTTQPLQDTTTVITNYKEKKITNNDTEDGWPDFTNLAKIVG